MLKVSRGRDGVKARDPGCSEGPNSTIHSHPDHFNGAQAGDQLPGVEIDMAKKIGSSIYVVSKSGLQVVGKDGKVTNVYSNPDWMSGDNK